MRGCFILFFTCLLFITGRTQVIEGKLHKAQCVSFRNNIYVSGYEETDKGLSFKLESYNDKGEKIKETAKPLGKGKASDFYPPTIDTSHGFLTCVIQRANNDKTGSLLRYTEHFKPVKAADNVELARINSLAAFVNEKLYYKHSLYMVREAKDSAGRFYFYRYDLDDSAVAFVYKFKWQFNFDQHTYHRIHPICATDDQIYLYVNCLDGEKKGQWILTLKTEDGRLNKAVKLNKNDNEMCFVSRLIVYGSQEDFALAGVKYPSANVDLKNGRFSMNYQTSKSLNTFFCQVDSAGEIKTRLENFFNVPNEILKEKEFKDMLFRCNLLEHSESGFNLSYENIFRGKDGIFRTFGFLCGNLVQTPEGVFKAGNNGFICTFRNEKKNSLCKLAVNQYDNDVPSAADRLFYKNSFTSAFTQPGIQIDTQKKMSYMLSGIENKKSATLEFYKYIMKNYACETIPLINISDYSRFRIMHITGNRFLIFNTNKEESSFTLNLTEL